MILEKIEKLLKEVSSVSAKNAEDVEQLRLKYLSKKGEINALMGEFRNVAADQKKTVHRPYPDSLSCWLGYPSSAYVGKERDYRYICTNGLYTLSGTGD